MKLLITVAVLAYLLGSIPFGYLLVRIFQGADVRKTGSGNIGATNVARTSPVLGIATLFLDALKGGLAVWLALSLLLRELPPAGTSTTLTPDRFAAMLDAATVVQLRIPLVGAVAALFAILGHAFPVWLKFRGGKGVATGLGAFLMLAPRAVLIVAILFVMVVAVFRYVSLASIVAASSFPVLAWLFEAYNGSALLVIIATSALIVAKHHSNIRRLLNGTESRLQVRHA